MKKRAVGLTVGLTAGILLSLMTINGFAAQVTEERAKSIALGNAGVKETDTSYVLTKADTEDGQPIFEVEFLTKDFKKYEYEINTADGMILSIDYELKKAPGQEKNTKKSKHASVTLEQAKSTAIDHAGETAETVIYDKAKTEYDDHRWVHEIDFHTADQKEYNYEIDKDTGEITEWSYDGKAYALFLQEKETNSTKDNSSVTLEDAKAIALNQAGLKETDVVWKKIKQDYEDGRLIYEGEFLSGRKEYEFEIDAATGNIIDWEMETED